MSVEAEKFTPANLTEMKGDLLEVEVDAIIHQCNCMSKGVSGLADVIFKRHPHANTYWTKNPDPRQFGSFEVHAVNDGPHKAVVNLFSQMYPGPATYGSDSAEARVNAFRQGLSSYFFTYGTALKSVAFPKYIGCGLAGGDWNRYYAEILTLAHWYPHIQFFIVEKQ